jgi:NAD-dependent SIR2 family protein deacetylase
MRDARCPVALTGAGISTFSGIPDFRSAGSGLWDNGEATAVASLSEFRHAPERSYEWVQECDLFLVVGSSREVNPVAGMPFQALGSGARLIIVNRQPTYLDCRAALVFHQAAAEVLAALADEVLCDRAPA